MSTRAVPFGKYHLLERVNVGGMAEVYKAKMVGVEGFEKLLAIKRILPSIAADKDFITMFIDEAKISVQLNHANIAQTFELGRIAETYYIALEFVPGRDLRAVFERMRRRNDVVPAELACYVMSRVAEGLDYAHRKKDASGRDLSIVHRDISPQNVLVSYEGEVKLIDFGIAKAAGKMMKTQAGILKGKFGYMSPEQVRGLPVDRRSDIFAAGIVLYELLVGDRLFTGDSDYSVLEKVRSANIPRPSNMRRSVPQPLEKIVLRALAKDPDDRYQHASELVADLQRFLLAQERLFTREDLSAFIKGSFADEFEREKKSTLDSQGMDLHLGDDGTPALPQNAESNELAIRSLGAKSDRPRLEGAAARSSMPPTPPTEAYGSDPARRDGERRPSPLRPSRLASAALAAETDKVDLAPLRSFEDDEDTATETDPLARASLPRLSPDDEMTPTPDDRLREEVIVTDLPTRIGRANNPPPVASQPPGARALSAPPRTTRMPVAITDHLPLPPRRAPPPVAEAGDEDEVSVDERGGRARPLSRSAGQPLSRGALRGLSDDDDEGESTEVSSGAPVYTPRRRSQWAIVPIAGAIALVIGFLTLRAVQHRWPFGRGNRPDDDLAAQALSPVVAEIPLGSLKVTTDPADAQLFVDQRLVKPGGDRPFLSEHVEAGVVHALVAKKDGFRDASTTVTLTKGATREVSLKLKALNATLSIVSTPLGATILIDDRDVAKTPEKIGTLKPGTYRLRVELKCYRPVERSITLKDDVALDLNLEPIPGACLAPRQQKSDEPGVLRLMARPPARVFVDGTDTGLTTPLQEFAIAPGRHKIRLVSDSGRSDELEVDIVAGKPLTKIVVLK